MLPFLSCRFIAKWCNCDNNWECLQCFILFTAWLGWTQTFLQVFGYLWWASVARENYSSNLNSNQITNQIQITFWSSSQGTDGSLFIEQGSSNCFGPQKVSNLPYVCIFRQRKLTWLKTVRFLPISKEFLKRVRI